MTQGYSGETETPTQGDCMPWRKFLELAGLVGYTPEQAADIFKRNEKALLDITRILLVGSTTPEAQR